MKKFIILVSVIFSMYLTYDYLVMYRGDVYIPKTNKTLEVISYANNGKLFFKNNKECNIRGIKLSKFIPGYSKDSKNLITKEKYMDWIKKISELGINMISLDELQPPEFYEAIYEYNRLHLNKEIYIIQGIFVDEDVYMKNIDAFDEKLEKSIEDSYKKTINAVHGNLKNGKILDFYVEKYKFDISKWVYSYSIYADWGQDIVEYTNNRNVEYEQYNGKYLYTKDASRFEVFLATIGDKLINYETERYSTQRNLSFTVYPSTDPLDYPENIKAFFEKFIGINIEKIQENDNYKSDVYISYDIYPYSLDYYDNKNKNLYKEYIKRINDFHKKPVVISEYGVPSSRGVAAYERNRNLARDYGRLTEKAQGEAIISMYKDILEMGSCGCVLNNWQDDWSENSWNTVTTIDIEKNIYWSDYQTNEQSFGLLSFDPGDKNKKIYNDGKKTEWNKEDIVYKSDEYNLSIKYDEKYIYYMIDIKGKNPRKENLFVPIDLTPKSGSDYISNFDICTNKCSDFVICLQGENNSKLLVQERFNTIEAIYGDIIKYKYNQFLNRPAKDSNKFVNVEGLLSEKKYYFDKKIISEEEFINRDRTKTKYYSLYKSEEVGNLLYGNGNPKLKDFNNLSDFCYGKDFIEIRIPWQLLNFYNPSEMEIHDDYYEHYGVEPLKIDQMYVGVGKSGEKIELAPMKLEGWGKKVTYHERLKESYYILKEYWNKEEAN